MAAGQLQDGVDGSRANQVDVELGLGEFLDEVTHTAMVHEATDFFA
jgi:hypothetical protein